MSDIYFQCDCGKSLAVDEAGIGLTFSCPDCNNSITIPKHTIRISCAKCGNEMLAPEAMMGKDIQCVNCKTTTTVALPTKADDSISFNCPHCKQSLKSPAALLGNIIKCPLCQKTVILPKQFPVRSPVHDAVKPSSSFHAPVQPYRKQNGSGCPLCGRPILTSQAKQLYGNSVCKKCYYAFANRRQLAFFLDIAAWRLLLFPMGFAIGLIMAASGASQLDIEGTATTLGWLLLLIFFCKDCFSGHSLGKLICGVKVIDAATGEPAGIGASFKRNLPLLVPFMPLIVAFQLCKGHRTGDGWSNTKVIWKKYASHPIFAPEGKA